MKYQNYLLTLLFAFFGFSASASHVAAGNIEYTHIAGDSFEVRMFFYRDCDGIAAPVNESLELHCSATNSNYSIPVTLTYAGEVSQICPSSLSQSACNVGSSGIEGVQLYTGTVIVDFSQYSPITCDNWILSFAVSARNVSLNGGTGNFFVTAELDNVNFPTNNSATYSNLSLPYMYPSSQYMTFDISATDPDGDSIVYSFDTALLSLFNPMSYQFGYGPQNPMPALTLDSFSGLVTLLGAPPLTGGEDNYIIVFRADEYDPNTGMHKGTTFRDFQAIIVGGGNDVPELQSTTLSNVSGASLLTPFSLEVIAGQNFCFDIAFNDSNLLDSLFVEANFGGFASNVTITQTGANSTTATICGTANSLPQLTTNLSFIVSARDNACPVYAVTSKSIKLTIISLGNLLDQTICAGDSVQMTVPGTQVSWTAISGSAISLGSNFDCDTCNTVNAYPSLTTEYEVQFDLAGLGTITDSVTVTVATPIAASIISSDTICLGDSLALSALGTGTGLTYNWSAPGGTIAMNGASTVSIFYSTFGTYNVSVTISNGVCAEVAIHQVIVAGPPTVNAGNDGMICSMQSIALGASGAQTYYWSPSSTLDNSMIANPTASPSQTTIYNVIGIDSNGCGAEDSVTVVVQPTYISGLAEDSAGQPIQNSWVYMVNYIASQDTVFALDSVLTDAGGAFQFLATQDSVFLKLVPDSANYPLYLPTYYNLTPLVQMAAVYNPIPCSLNAVVIEALPGTNPGGAGFIGGYVSLGAGRAEAVSNLSMVLRTENGEYVAQTYTNEQGYFRFDNLEDGSYFMDVDQWGVQTLNAPNILVSEGSGRDDYQFVLYSKYLDLLAPTGLLEESGSTLSVYPNPVDGVLKIQGLESVSIVEVLSMDGKVLIQQTLRSGTYSLDLSALSQGTYVISVTGSGQVERTVIVKN